MTYPILDFDPGRNAILTPRQYATKEPLPQRGVLCFFADVLRKLKRGNRLKKTASFTSEMGANPIYLWDDGGEPVFVLQPGIGAPLAAGFLEEAIAHGGRQFIVCGGCGVLDPTIARGYPVMLTGAVRDEGTSYHYLPPADEVSADLIGLAALESTFAANKLPYHLGKAWTTDAFYRETPARRERRVAQGCSVVEMEAAALFAVAQFRQVPLGIVVYGGDLVVPEGWDSRQWNRMMEVRQRLLELAVEAVRGMAN